MKTLTTDERNEMLQVYSDFHKDAHGYRPRWDYSSLSDEELINHFNSFNAICKENKINEDFAENQALTDFEALINKTIQLGANDRKTALAWLWEGSEELYDVSYFLWQHGISTYTDKGKQLFNEIVAICEERNLLQMV